MNSPIRIPTKECIELYENIEKNNYNCWPSYPAIDCNNISLIGRDGNMWKSIDNTWVCTGLIKADREAASTKGSDRFIGAVGDRGAAAAEGGDSLGTAEKPASFDFREAGVVDVDAPQPEVTAKGGGR